MNILICGVFDLIHIGHINFLNKIKKEGDKLYILINTDRFVSTYKRIPIINENDRLQMIKNIKCVDYSFIDDNEYLTKDIIDKYNIDKVYQAVDSSTIWNYYYNVAIKMGIINFINYDNNTTSTTNIINNIKLLTKTEDNYDVRYTKENILKSEKLYGYGWQSVGGESILMEILPFNQYKNILEIGCGLGGNCNYLINHYKCNIIGIDISKIMIDICNERNKNNNVKFLVADYNNFNTDEKFDLILCRDVFLYLDTEKKYNYLKKVKSQLSKDGIFILIDYCRGNIKNKEFTEYCMNRKWNVIDISFYKQLITDSEFSIINEGDLSQTYIKFCSNNLNINIDEDIKENTNKKIKYLNNDWFKWYFFILQ